MLYSPINILLLLEGGSLPGPKRRLLSNTQKWFVRGDTRVDKAKDLIGNEFLSGEQQGRESGELLCHVACSLSFYGNGVNFPGCLCLIILLVPISGPTQGTSWWHPSLSRWSLGWGFLGSWEDILWADLCSLILTPPEFFQLATACCFCVPYWDLLLWDRSCKRLLSCLAW